MLTAAIRDLHLAHPGQFQTDVRSPAAALWRHNPHLTPLDEQDSDTETIEVHYPLVHHSNDRPCHFLEGYIRFLERYLGVDIPISRFGGDIHLSDDERQAPCQLQEFGYQGDFWIIVAGGKFDFTTKWWHPDYYQEVVDRLRGRVQFVQCGEAGHWHVPLKGVINLVGQTSLRQFVLLMHHADGVLCPITLAMHLAAAVPTRAGQPPWRPCVVIAGGREPPHWEAYPQHQFLHTVGMLSCCTTGGCWKSRCQRLGDDDPKDVGELCAQPIPVSSTLSIPRCMHMIRPEDVERHIRSYYEGDLFSRRSLLSTSTASNSPGDDRQLRRRSILIEFRHGLGDAVQLTVVLRHLARFHPEWDVDVALPLAYRPLLEGLCRNVVDLDTPDGDALYDRRFRLDWEECRVGYDGHPSTKATQCLKDCFFVPPAAELCTYSLGIPAAVRQQAQEYLAMICPALEARGRFRAVVIHYQGRSSSDQRDLADDLVARLCDVVHAHGGVAVILDWERRSVAPARAGIHFIQPPADRSPPFSMTLIAALIAHSALFVGIDSGPLRVAGATDTPAIGVWTRQHPVHGFDLADNVLHLVPQGHAAMIAGRPAQAYFHARYRYREYEHLELELLSQVESQLTSRPLHEVRSRRFLEQFAPAGFGPRYYHEAKLAGLDYRSFSHWHDRYARWLVTALAWQGQRILDAGCACGACARGLIRAGAMVTGVDINEFMVRAGRQAWPEIADDLFVCDLAHLHLWADESFDAVHFAQTGDQLAPESIGTVLRELRRVTKRGGVLFATLRTLEHVAATKAPPFQEPRLTGLFARRWWRQCFAASGWRECSDAYATRLRASDDCCLGQLLADWFVAQACDRERQDAQLRPCEVSL